MVHPISKFPYRVKSKLFDTVPWNFTRMYMYILRNTTHNFEHLWWMVTKYTSVSGCWLEDNGQQDERQANAKGTTYA